MLVSCSCLVYIRCWRRGVRVSYSFTFAPLCRSENNLFLSGQGGRDCGCFGKATSGSRCIYPFTRGLFIDIVFVGHFLGEAPCLCLKIVVYACFWSCLCSFLLETWPGHPQLTIDPWIPWVQHRVIVRDSYLEEQRMGNFERLFPTEDSRSYDGFFKVRRP